MLNINIECDLIHYYTNCIIILIFLTILFIIKTDRYCIPNIILINILLYYSYSTDTDMIYYLIIISNVGTYLFLYNDVNSQTADTNLRSFLKILTHPSSLSKKYEYVGIAEIRNMYN